MTRKNARKFVTRMRDDAGFRNRVLATGGPDDLLSLLQQEDLPFNQRELVAAMAECMQQLESQTDS